jgi:CHAD domain-containing protein
MPYRLKTSESLPQGLRRLVDEQIGRALDSIGRAAEASDEAIHDVRKRLKKCRAALRLVRDEVGKEVYQRENRCFRDAGRLLSEARDSAVHVQTLRQVRGEFIDGLPAGAFAGLEARLRQSHRSALERALGDDRPLDQVAAALKGARERSEDWPIGDDGFDAVESGLKRVHGRCCRGLGNCEDSPSTDDLHDWRKRLKYLRYQIRILVDLWPGMMEAFEDALHDLTDDLGYDHDLAELQSRVCEVAEIEEVEQWDVLAGLVSRRRVELQARAVERGSRCLALKTGCFVAVMGALWREAHD